jgi:hypothetical protein
MASYFRNLPNFNYISRLPENKNLGDYIEVKNIFYRGKIREDIFGNLSFFEKYRVIGDERPDNVAYKVYNDETLDWVVLLSNNILNVYDEWPKTQQALDKYLLEKYKSYDNLYNGIHHYETKEYKTSTGVSIVKPNVVVDETFYKAPQYIVETDPNINLPKAVPGINATAFAEILDYKVSKVTVSNVGSAYTSVPNVIFSDPDTVVTATATATLSILPGEREVSSVSITNNGSGYTTAPKITFTDPPKTKEPVTTAILGIGGTVTDVTINDGGDGYTFVPTVSFSTPDNIIGNAAFLNQSTFTTGTGLEGMYVSQDGTRLYTAHGSAGYTQGTIEQYTLSTPWDITTGSYNRTYTLNTGISFTYATGVEFKPDGKVMYVSGLTSSGYKVAAYNLSTAWNISTASYFNSVSVPSPSGVRLQDNGRFMFICDANNPDTIRKYSLSIAWNISTKSAVEVSNVNLFNLTGEDWFLGFSFSDDGTQLYAAGNTTDKVYVFNLTSPWLPSSAVLITQLSTSAQDTAVTDVYINSDKTRLFTSGAQNRKVFEYNVDLTAKGYAIIFDEKLVQVVITDPGGGYNVPPTLSIQPPIKERTAKGYTILSNGQVGQIILTDPGYNYQFRPSIIIEDPSQPITATGYARIFKGEVTEIILSNTGSGYTTPPSITIGKPGNIYEPSLDEIYEKGGIVWKYNGYNWYKKISNGVTYFDSNYNKVFEIKGTDCSYPVSNYEYEIKKEDEKRVIFLIKPKYLNILLNDIENIMAYKEGSEQYVSRTLKKGDNPRIYE